MGPSQAGAAVGVGLPHAGQPIRLFIVARVRLYREGLAQALSTDPRFVVLGTAATHDEGWRAVAATDSRPDALLIDGAGGSGLAGARLLRATLPDVPVVALAIDDNDDDVIAWAETGVSGLVTPNTALEELIAIVEAVVRGGARCSPWATAALFRRVAALAGHHLRGAAAGPSATTGFGAARSAAAAQARPRLTPRECDVITLIDRGLSNKQIASQLQIELATVKNHVHAILEKLHVERRGEAAAVARMQRLLA